MGRRVHAVVMLRSSVKNTDALDSTDEKTSHVMITREVFVRFFNVP
jgi:hypothetical protein